MSRWELLPGANQGAGLFQIRGFVIDIDGTVYRHKNYHEDGTRGEITEIAMILRQSYGEVEILIATAKQIIASQTGRPSTMTEAVLFCGVTRSQWNELRCRAWEPEKWLKPDSGLCRILCSLAERYKVAFATNSPRQVGMRVLKTVGITDAMPDVPVFGPEDFAVSKPNPAFFSSVAERLGLSPQECFSIGDRVESDGVPAVAAGYAGITIVDGPEGLAEVISTFFLWR